MHLIALAFETLFLPPGIDFVALMLAFTFPWYLETLFMFF